MLSIASRTDGGTVSGEEICSEILILGDHYTEANNIAAKNKKTRSSLRAT